MMRIIRPEDVTAEDFASVSFEELTPDELREVYAQMRAEITPADLDGFKDLDNTVPFDEVLRQLEEMQQQARSRAPD